MRGVLEAVLAALQRHLQLTHAREYLTIALWALHTFVFDMFQMTPRLIFASPVRGCGKTTALALLAALCARAKRVDGVSAAALFRLIEREHPTLLCDDADTYALKSDAPLRQVLHSGHRRDGRILRSTRDGDLPEFSTFAPISLAAIGVDTLPLPLLDRSIFIPMQRADGTRPLTRLDNENLAELGLVSGRLHAWARRVTLNRNPEMPPKLRNRAADNWRPLIAIADACGADWGGRVREAAIALSGDQEEEPGVTLLQDIREIFDARDSRSLVQSRTGRGALGDGGFSVG
jgi:hypothetical protein